MGGVAGHAGVFATAHDVSIYAQALLDRLAGRPSEFPLTQATLELMTTPEQPGHTAQQLQAANDTARRAIAKAPNSNPLLAPNYPAIKGQNLRGFGWDIDTRLSVARGMVFPIGSFGHTGFTGTMLWMDPGSDTYVILFANAIHVRGSPPMSNLQGEVATATAQALRLYGS
jgi:CubicO group peptidase (beta-lactamase class C family)